MKALYLKTPGGAVPIDPSQVEKYHLEVGAISPLSGCVVVDDHGNADKKPDKHRLSDLFSADDLMTDGVIFTTSEVLDLARGADSGDTGSLMPE